MVAPKIVTSSAETVDNGTPNQDARNQEREHQYPSNDAPHTQPSISSSTTASVPTYHRPDGSDIAISSSTNSRAREAESDRSRGRALDLNDAHHGPVDIPSYKGDGDPGWYADLRAFGDTTLSPTIPLVTGPDDNKYTIRMRKPFEIVNTIDSLIKYDFEYGNSEFMSNDFNPIDSTISTLFGESANLFRNGTTLVKFSIIDRILSYYPKETTMLATITRENTAANESEYILSILVDFVANRKVLHIQSSTVVKENTRSKFIQTQVPTQSFASPLLRLDCARDPLWYNTAIHNLVKDLDIKYGKTKTVLNEESVPIIHVYSVPIDQYQAALYNFNALASSSMTVSHEMLVALIRALSYEFDQPTISYSPYQLVAPWFDTRDLTRLVFVLCMCPNVNMLSHVINVRYLERAVPFAVQSTNILLTRMTVIDETSAYMGNYFKERIKVVTNGDIYDAFAREVTPILGRLHLVPGEYEKDLPSFALYIIELCLFVTIFPNTSQHILAPLQDQLLEFCRIYFYSEYPIFLSNFGFSYRMRNGKHQYAPVADPASRMPLDMDLLYSEWFPSLFAEDPQIAKLCPNMYKFISLFRLPKTNIRDTRAEKARFPRFKDPNHLNPYQMLPPRYQSSHSHTARRIDGLLRALVPMLDSMLRKKLTNKARARLQELSGILISCGNILGLELDGHMYHLLNVLANLPHNFVANSDGNPLFRPCPYAVVDGPRIYPLASPAEDNKSKGMMIDTAIIWTLFGGVSTAYGTAIGLDGTARVPTSEQPVIPTPDSFIDDIMKLMNLVKAVSSVEGITQYMLSDKTIPGCELGLTRLRAGVIKPHTVDRQYANVREVIRKNLGKGDYDFATLERYYGDMRRSTKLFDPKIRAVDGGIVIPFRPTIDPAEFQYLQALLDDDDMQRLKIGLKFIASDMFKICQGIVLHPKDSPKFDIYEQLTIPTTVKKIDYSFDLIKGVLRHDRYYYEFSIDNVSYSASSVKDVCFVVKETGVIPPEHIKLLITAVLQGTNVYIDLPNLKFFPEITSVANRFNVTYSMEQLLAANNSIIHRIPFFDNTMNPLVASDILPTANMVTRRIWNSNPIKHTISTRGILSYKNARPADAHLPSLLELDMGTLDDKTGDNKYTSGVNKLAASSVSMMNQVMTLASDVIKEGSVQFSLSRSRLLIP